MKKKLLLIFFVILVLILNFNNFSFASHDVSVDDDGTFYTFTINDELCSFKYYAFFFYSFSNSDSNNILFIGSDSSFYFSFNESKQHYDLFLDDYTSSLYYYDYSLFKNFDTAISQFNNCTVSDLRLYTFGDSSSYFASSNFSYINNGLFIYSNFDVKDSEGNLINSSSINTKKNPYFITTQEELETGNIDKLVISGGDHKDTDDIFYLQSMYYPKDVTEDESFQSLFPVKEIALRPFYSEYYVGVNNSNEYIYEIPRADLGIDLIEGNKYAFHLGVYDGDLFNRLARLSFTVGVVNPDDVTNDKLDQQTDAIKENTETQKGIWETIKDILSYINPFSENFFVYKLIELLVEAIKSLFIPSDDFLGTYFTDLKEWFSDRLGFLFYPFELVIDILNMILDIDFSEPVFNIPDITEPFSNKKLISATTFKFNDLLENNTFNTIHSIYLVCVDVFVVFGLVNLFRKKYEEVTTK